MTARHRMRDLEGERSDNGPHGKCLDLHPRFVNTTGVTAEIIYSAMHMCTPRYLFMRVRARARAGQMAGCDMLSISPTGESGRNTVASCLSESIRENHSVSAAMVTK